MTCRESSRYLDEQGFDSNDEGCYLKFTGDDRSSICIKQVGSASTDVQKSKTDQLLLVGTGEFTLPIEGNLEDRGRLSGFKGDPEKEQFRRN